MVEDEETIHPLRCACFPPSDFVKEGVKLPAYHLFAVDLNWPATKPPILNGDNQLTVRLIHKNQKSPSSVVIDELEFYVYVR